MVDFKGDVTRNDIVVREESVPKRREDYTRIGNTLVLSAMLENYSRRDEIITLTDGTTIKVDVNDWTQKGKGEAVISRNEKGEIVLSNFHQQFPTIKGTDKSDKYRIYDSEDITVDTGEGCDEVCINNSTGTKILSHKTTEGGTTVGKTDVGSSIEIYHSKPGIPSDYSVFKKGNIGYGYY